MTYIPCSSQHSVWKSPAVWKPHQPQNILCCLLDVSSEQQVAAFQNNLGQTAASSTGTDAQSEPCLTGKPEQGSM